MIEREEQYLDTIESTISMLEVGYSGAVKPPVRQFGNR